MFCSRVDIPHLYYYTSTSTYLTHVHVILSLLKRIGATSEIDSMRRMSENSGRLMTNCGRCALIDPPRDAAAYRHGNGAPCFSQRYFDQRGRVHRGGEKARTRSKGKAFWHVDLPRVSPLRTTPRQLSGRCVTPRMYRDVIPQTCRWGLISRV